MNGAAGGWNGRLNPWFCLGEVPRPVLPLPLKLRRDETLRPRLVCVGPSGFEGGMTTDL